MQRKWIFGTLSICCSFVIPSIMSVTFYLTIWAKLQRRHCELELKISFIKVICDQKVSIKLEALKSKFFGIIAQTYLQPHYG